MSDSLYVDRVWKCRNVNCATFLAYCMEDGSHVATVMEPKGPCFQFSDAVKCRELTDEFNGQEPLVIGDLKTYLAIGKQVRGTIRAAEANGGLWESA